MLLPTVILMGSPAALGDQAVNGCMQDRAGFDLVCTANDVRIASATNITIHDTDGGCAFPGDTVSFTATFEVVLGAQERHDIGLYFATDGDPNEDGAISGFCTITTMPYKPEPDWLDLDGTNDPYPGENKPSGIQDTCGDIDDNHNPLFPTVTLTNVACIDPDGDGKLNLPNCTSWRQPGANDLCQGPLDAFPGAPSKCRCDIGFNVDIDVPAAELLVTKTANPSEVDEPGGPVTFSVSVTNIGIDPNNPVTVNSLVDDPYGDITVPQDDVTATTCSVPQNLPVDDANPGGIDTYECSFTANVAGNAGDVKTDTVTAIAIDEHGNEISGSDSATVTINDVQPSITVVKTADPVEVLEPGGNVNFTVLVTNNSVSSDPVTIDSLIDSVHGDLNGQGDCEVPQTLAGNGGDFSCSFTAFVAGNAGYVETDTVTASGADDDGNPVSAADSATVTVVNVPSEIELIKIANPTAVDEPGGSITYNITVNNKSAVDTVTIESLLDSILGDLNGQGDCSVPQVLLPGGSYTCTVIAPVSGNAGDAITNTATATGTDDDGDPVSASDDATVNIDNVPPAASLAKTATEALVTYAVEVCNDSDAEALTLDALADDIYGDIASGVNLALTETTCTVPQTLAPAGQLGDCYSCTFKAATTTSPTTDTVTGTVNDDDGSNPSTPSDSATVTFE